LQLPRFGPRLLLPITGCIKATLLKKRSPTGWWWRSCLFLKLTGGNGTWKAQVGDLAGGIEHFLKVTRSYWPGLFHCYDIQGLHRTNNDLEHIFGQWRHHQRRCTGRCIGITHSGDSWLGAAGCCHCDSTQAPRASDLSTVSRSAWQQVRTQLKISTTTGSTATQFRRSPTTYCVFGAETSPASLPQRKRTSVQQVNLLVLEQLNPEQVEVEIV